MARQITFAGGCYDRTQALIDGTVKPEGLELNWMILPYGELWRRMLNHYDFDASELSFSSYIIARSMGKPLLAIPVFPARAFRHSYVFINSKNVRDPSDLAGKRFALMEFQQTATVWIRGILQDEYGLKLEQVHWHAWERQERMPIEMRKKYDIQLIPEGKKPDEMLIKGELDALICPFLFPSLLQAKPTVRRLFEDYKKEEMAFFKKTSIFPMMHTVAMREDRWREIPWMAPSLLKAFQRAKEQAYANLHHDNAYKISLVWFRGPVEEQDNFLGEDPWPYGVTKNRKVVETLTRYLHEQGLTERQMMPEDLFAPNAMEITESQYEWGAR